MKKTAALVTGAILALGLAGPAFADADATGTANNSPGVLSGNVVQVPIHIPINLCGNTIDIIALLNPALANHCSNS
ncbi:chaplin [Streptomyces actinomycinicus]|uniref:Chaplin n=1 Tax=Streptomyces actinomycinicus TaxID=1695166 RepID=A0A937ED80_9ACTN|nr:chaplin [Streptomyces actinomycinicus]MBL1080586.1 chaplin [Streptomyces actinomycinicus]